MNGSWRVTLGLVSSLITWLTLKRVLIPISLKFWHNFVKPITWDGPDSFPPKGSQLISLYKPLASLASSVIHSTCNHDELGVNERARSASGFVSLNVRLSVPLCYTIKTQQLLTLLQYIKMITNVLTYDLIWCILNV